ncbi:MAG: extracellular solute-binding protein [Bacteroidota bacterium]|nr:extracellular solute-binding protein [Candidatus Kapabacteria bacterium]MCS7302183.1 extracellular solute-binding protein [Candidatus Kapabacteria bacterium]MDW8074332.1 extracellular solute-binding protein [Bacteroidota bacterium]MDW8271192.1 extracellular solute-binding protein [Bacteroidota bacterium]
MKNCHRVLSNLNRWLGVLTTIALLSCSDKQHSDSVLRVWHFWSAPQHQRVLQALVREFERQANCRVELTPLSWNEGKTKLMAAFNSGTVPDVLELGSDWIAQYSSAGVLAELPGEFVQPHQWLEWALPPCQWQGRYYAVPWIVDTRVLFVNTALLSQAGVSLPKNLDDLLAVAIAVHQHTNASGFAATGADEHRLYKKILPFIWTLGGDILDTNGRCVLYSEPNIRALELYVLLSRNGIIDTQKQLDAAFTRGEVALWQSGSWLIEKIERENPSLPYTVIPLPGVRPSQYGISFAGGEYWAIARSSQQQELARAFIAFMTECSRVVRFCREVPEAGFPARRACAADSTVISHRHKRVFAEQLHAARMTPVHPRWLEIEQALEAAVVDVLYGKATASAALRAAHAKIAELVAQTQKGQ